LIFPLCLAATLSIEENTPVGTELVVLYIFFCHIFYFLAGCNLIFSEPENRFPREDENIFNAKKSS
jgi:hypothetical protein